MSAFRRLSAGKLLLTLTFAAQWSHCAADTIPVAREDTLAMVVVNGRKEPGVVRAIERSLKANQQPRVKSLGEILNERFPMLMDCILHPFAFRARKKERRQKRLKKILWEYENYKTPNELLLEAIKAEQLRDSLSAAKHLEN